MQIPTVLSNVFSTYYRITLLGDSGVQSAALYYQLAKPDPLSGSQSLWSCDLPLALALSLSPANSSILLTQGS